MGAGVMLISGDKTLILKRADYKDDPYANYWNFPGGTGEEGESAYETALRETYEETSIAPDQFKVYNEVRIRGYTMYLGSVEDEIEPTLDHEHIDWRWVPISSVLTIKNLHPKDLKSLLKMKMLNGFHSKLLQR